MSEPQFDVVLIDGTNVAHRAWHASPAPNALDASGMLTAMVKNAIEAHKPAYAAVAIDAPTCFRHQLYPDYKAKRVERPEEQTDWLHALRDLDNIGGVPVVMADDHEADDVVATLCAEAMGHNSNLIASRGNGYLLNILILTSDLDAYALVGQHVTVGKPALYSRGPYFTATAVHEKYGVWPHQVAAYKALAGDHSDNVHGVPGIGPVAARKLLAQAPGGPLTAFNIITSPPARVPPAEAKQRALICHAVTLLRRDAPVNRPLAECSINRRRVA